MKKLLRLLTLTLCFTLLFSVTVLADDNGDEKGKGGGDDGYVDGISDAKTGYLIYITDKGGNVLTSVKAISTVAGVIPTGNAQVKLAPAVDAYNTGKYSGIQIDPCGVESMWNMPPFSTTAGGNGAKIKNWLIDKGGAKNSANAYIVIKTLWGDAWAEQFAKAQNDEYTLIVEGFCWAGSARTVAGYTANYTYCGTAKTWSILNSTGKNSRAGDFKLYTQGQLAYGMHFIKDWCGLNAPTDFSTILDTSTILAPYGYGVVAVRCNEVNDIEVKPVTNNDSVQEWELNYIFANFFGKRDGKAGTIGKIDYAGHECKDEDVSEEVGNIGNKKCQVGYTIKETREGDLTSFMANLNKVPLFYNSASGLYYSTSSKGKEASQTASDIKDVTYPQYAYTTSRKMFEDNILICPYVTNTNGYANNVTFAKDYLGIDVATLDQIKTGDLKSDLKWSQNVGGTIPGTKTDKYTFKGEHSVTSVSGIWGDPPNDKVYVDASSSTSTEDKNPDAGSPYTVNHYCDKYRTYTLGAASLGNSVISHDGNKSDGTQDEGYFTQASSSLMVYPEVKYSIWTTPSGSYSPSESEIYMMGEFERGIQSQAIHIYRLALNGTPLTGVTTLSSPQTGSNASTAVKNWGGDMVGATAQGTNFSTAETQQTTLHGLTVALDIRPEMNKYYADGFEPVKSHEAFMTTLVNCAEPTLTLQLRNKSGQSLNGDGYKLNTSFTKAKLIADKSGISVNIDFVDGNITNINEVKQAVSSAGFGAYADDVANRLNEAFQQAFVTSGDSDNKSKGKWYCEDSHAYRVVIYHSTAGFSGVTAQDKIDFGEVGALSLGSAGSELIQADILYNFEFKCPKDVCFDNYIGKLPEYVVKGVPTSGTSFLVSSSTSSNMRK